MNRDTEMVGSFLQGAFYLIMIIVFFVMTTNIGTMTKLLREILKELKDSKDPLIQKAKKMDETA